MTLNNFRLKCLQHNDDGEKYITNVKELNHVTSLTMSYDGLKLDKSKGIQAVRLDFISIRNGKM